MKLGPVTKPYKKTKTTSKNLTMTSCWKIVTSVPFSCLQPIRRNPEAGF